MKTAEEIVDEIESVEDIPVEGNVFDDPLVQRVLSRTIENDEIPHLEVALMELALWDLYLNSETIEERLGEVEKSMTRNYSRAITKTYFKMRESGYDVDELVRKYLSPISKERREKGSKWITIPEYERTDGTIVEEHTRRIPTDMTRRSLDELQEIASEVKEASESEYGRKQLNSGKGRQLLNDKKYDAAQLLVDDWNRRLDNAKRVLQESPDYMRAGEEVRRMDRRHEAALREDKSREESAAQIAARHKKLDGINAKLHDEMYTGAAKSALEGETWGQRVVNVAEYFTKSKDKRATTSVKFAANAIKEYGPLTGMRVAHAYMRYGGYDVPIQTDETGTRTTEQGDVIPPAVSPSVTRDWAVSLLVSRLPSQKTYDAGAKPPSEGFVINGEGEVIAHGIGRGMDHYIPFNTRHLKKMRKSDRVEFVRSRMVGGPTVEDLHAAMMMGADKLTVVSNSGTYSVDFTQRSHGVKIEHFQVLTRYQEILDEYQTEGQNRKTRRSLDHAGYSRALQSISDEFPLHINFDESSAVAGSWEKHHDYVQPSNRLMDQLKKLFGLQVEDRSYSDAARAKNAPGTRDLGITGGKQISTWWTNELARKPSNADDLDWRINRLQALRNDRIARGLHGLPREYDERLQGYLEQRLSRDTGVSQGRMGQITDHRDKAQEELRTSTYGTVVESQIDPDDSPPPSWGATEFKNEATKKFRRATKFIEEHGYSVGAHQDRDQAMMLLEATERALNNAREDGMNEDWIFDQMELQIDGQFRLK